MAKLCAAIVCSLIIILHVDGESIPPNIVVIIADDLGWATVGMHDNEVQTPFIDNLAIEESLILNRHYVYKYCSPTRSSFLSGRLPLHVNQQNREVWQPGGGVHLGMYILPKILKMSKQATYHTHQFGKWHSGMSNTAYLPVSRGFDSSFGYLGGAEDHYTHVQGDGIDFWNTSQPITQYKGVYGDLIYNELAVNTIKTFANKYESDSAHRLFIYMALQVVHDPQEVPQQYLDLYPSNMYGKRRSMDAMASLMDNAVMNITNALKSTGLWQNTVLLFTADNGGASGVNSKSGNNWPLRGGKHSDFEGGVRATAFVSGGFLPDDRKGKSLDGYIHICDWYETFAQMVGVDTSKLHPLTNETIPDIDSLNVWPMIEGKNLTSSRVEIPLSSVGALYGSAFISGNYKIVLKAQNNLGFFTGPQSPNNTSPYHDKGCPNTCLFDIISDPTEHVDLSDTYPNIKQKLLNRHYEISNGSYQTDCYGVQVNSSQAKNIAIKAQIDGVWAPYNMCLLTNSSIDNLL